MWVKVTEPDGIEFFVNLDRFDRIDVIEERGLQGLQGRQLTRISVTLSRTEEDEYYIDVKETPEEIMRRAGVFVSSP